MIIIEQTCRFPSGYNISVIQNYNPCKQLIKLHEVHAMFCCRHFYSVRIESHCRHRSIEFLTTQTDQSKLDILIHYVLIIFKLGTFGGDLVPKDELSKLQLIGTGVDFPSVKNFFNCSLVTHTSPEKHIIIVISECKIVCHSRCAPSLGTNCGAPDQSPSRINRRYRTNRPPSTIKKLADTLISTSSLDSEDGGETFKVEGWMKIPRKLVLFLITF